MPSSVSTELRKIAAQLRQADEERKTEKTVKCAQVLQAAVGLATLRRKIG